MSIDCPQLALTYVQTCCYTFSISDFGKIISKNVKLSNKTNDEPLVRATGREVVTKLFNKFIFTNTSQVEVQDTRIKREKEKVVLNLIVKENKKEEGKINRYLFHETTTFSFKKRKDESYKICNIDMQIKKESIESD